MPLTGDFSALRALAAKLDRFSFGKLVKAMGEESAVQYSTDFSAQRDPWGDAWSNKSGKGPVNRVTGNLASPSLSIGGSTIKLKLEDYWVFRQIGANNSTPAAVVPFGSMEATVWAEPMKAMAERSIADQIGQKP